MANVQKYTRARVGGLTRHYERAKKENGEYYQFSNQEVDTARTHLNYNLAPARDQLAFISRRTSEVECVSRANINVMCSWVVTAPKELDEWELHRFFEESYKFLNDRYAGGSDKNVVSAYVHMDEVSPHLHYAFVPVVHDEKKEIDKVSAKAMINRRDLQMFHKDLERHMATVFGREIGILNEATKDGNKSIEELKRGSARQEADTIRDEVKDLQTDKKSLEAEMTSQTAIFDEKKHALINDYEKNKRVLEGRLGALGDELKGKQLSRKKIENIEVHISRPVIGGADKDKATMLLKDWESVKKTALMNADIKNEFPELKKQVTELRKDKNKLENELANEKRSAQLSIKVQIERNLFQERVKNVPKAELNALIEKYNSNNRPEKVRGTPER